MRRSIGWIGAELAAGVVLLTPFVSRACAVCTAGRDEENAFAFLMTTIFMSIMPLAALGTLIFVLWRRMQKLEREQAVSSRLEGTADPRPSGPAAAPRSS